MTSALYGAAMDNPMACMPYEMHAPVPEEIHKCPGCGALWERWEDCSSWQHDTGIFRVSHKDPVAEHCCPRCAADSANRSDVVQFVEQRGIESEVLAYAMIKDGEGEFEPEYVPRLWALAKCITPAEDFWPTVLDYIGEFHRSAFYEFRRRNGV